MSGSIRKRARSAAFAIGVGVIGLLATASPSYALYPRQGAACQTDGKIDGVGSTLAANLQNNALIQGYTQDECGYVGAATNLNTTNQSGGTAWSADPTLTATSPALPGGMIAYNWTTQDSLKSDNGSGEGLEAMQCRIDEFGGSDIPYAEGMLDALNGATTTNWYAADPFQVNNTPAGNVWGALGTSTGATCAVNTNVTPPFPPGPATAAAETAAGFSYTTGYPNLEGDTDASFTDPMMSFPIGAGAAAIVANLAGCTSLPDPVSLSGSVLANVMAGQYATWASVPGASGWGCGTLPIKRDVRQDSSGTTYATMTYLNKVGTFPLCDGSTSFQSVQNPGTTSGTVNDSVWPDNTGGAGTCADPGVTYGTGTGSPTIAPASSPSMVYNVTGTPGGIGYGELSNWKGAQAPTFSADLSTTVGPSEVTYGGTGNIPLPYVGEGITGTDIPASDTITAVSGAGTSSLALELSSPPTANVTTAETVTLAASGLNYVFLPAATTGTSTGPGSSQTTSPVSNSTLAANCGDATSTLSASSLPGAGSDSTGPVGLDANGWAVDQPAPVPGDIIDTSDQWPLCTFTYDFVYSGFPRGTAGSAGSALVTSGPLQGITFDQERTLYAYFSYVLTPAAQAFEQAQGYQPVPAAWLPDIRAAFQSNF
jgi:hypothetical protein